MVVAVLSVAACRTGRNYPDPQSPRYGSTTSGLATRAHGDTVRVVSFNIEFSREMPRAIEMLRTHPLLRDADVVLLQEMNAQAARMAADSLRMNHVYYPAIYNRVMRRDVGNAVLSRWPIVDDAKLILPSRSRYAKTQRIATAATIEIGNTRVRVYSTHLGTPADLGWEGRVDQLRHIVTDAEQYDLVIIGGDMNSPDIGKVARDAGYLWPTDTIPKSTSFGRLDHFFLKGFRIADSAGAGTARIEPVVSDHSPVWIAALPAPR